MPSRVKQAELTAEITGLGVLRLLEAIRVVRQRPERPTRSASTRRPLGDVRQGPRDPADRATPFHPRSPYGVAKAYAHYMTVNYRESYGMYAASRHPVQPRVAPPRREFVTRKVTTRVARIKLGLQDELALGNLDARRDWGFAGDYVRAMWLMLQQDEPDDYVIATGETHSVRELLELPSRASGSNWETHVVHGPALHPAGRGRPAAAATRPRPARSWAGSRRSRSRSW